MSWGIMSSGQCLTAPISTVNASDKMKENAEEKM